MSENTKKTNTENNEFINSEEFEVAEREAKMSAGQSVYVHKLSKPFTYEDKTYEEFTFEWDKLTGNDYLAIEAEMGAIGKVLITPEFSGEFVVRMATKACTENIGSDVLCALPLNDFNKIRGKARSFLMNSAS